MPKPMFKSSQHAEEKERQTRNRQNNSNEISGLEIKALLKDAGLSVYEMAALMHCSPRTLWNLQAGKKREIGKMMDLLLTLLCYAPTRAMIGEAGAHRKKVWMDRQKP